MGWAKLREARTEGRFVPTIAERQRQAADEMRYDSRKGGWQQSSSTWSGPPSASANRNVRVAANAPATSIYAVSQDARKEQLRSFFSAQFTGQPPPPM